jgi:hypothetical protein
MLRAVDQPALVTEGEPKDFRGLELRKLRLTETVNRCRKCFVTLVLRVGVDPDPLVNCLDQRSLLGPIVFVLLAVCVGAANRHDAEAALLVTVKYRVASVTVMPIALNGSTMSGVTAK